MLTMKGIYNLEINKEDRFVLVSINPKIYPLNVIYSAAYMFIDRAYVMIDGDPESKVIVELRPKKSLEDLNKLGGDFNNELLHYAVYETQSKESSMIRAVLMKRVLLTNTGDQTEEDWFENPEGITIPWEEDQGDKEHEGS